MKCLLKHFGKILQGAITLLLALLLLCNLYLIVMERMVGIENPTIFGYSTAVVASGSMEPALSVDDLVLNHAQSSYTEGDIITFRSGISLTTHRIVDVTESGYSTRGDANNTADPDAVAPEDVVGRVVGKLPRIGRVLSFFKTPLGMMALVFAGILILALPFFSRRNSDERGGDK